MNTKNGYAWSILRSLLPWLALATGFGHLAAQVPDPKASQTPEPKVELTWDQCEQLVQHQAILPDAGIFSGDVFPKIDFQNKDLVKAALGSYVLTTRFFDAGWNEVQKPAGPGRYGAWVEVRFPNKVVDVRHLTLFKLTAPYRPRKDPYQIEAEYPLAFGIPKELEKQEAWNSADFLNGLLNNVFHDNDDSAVLVAAMHDVESEPARWHGFDLWHVDTAWWTGLENKLGLFREYQRLVQVPADYDAKPAEKWPLLLFLHGSGERSDDLNKLRDQGPLGYVNQGHPLPFVIVEPQCPRRDWWNSERLLSLIDQIEATYRIDPKRIYVTGLSMGGYGTFDLAGVCPQRIAAIAPLSGGANPEIADRIKGIPTWIFHGEDDAVVPARYSVDVTERMKAAGADVTLSLLPGVAHGGWDKIYSDPALYAWFLKYSLK